jgi:hypothetical protein
MAGAINYTVVTDTSADFASVANSTYFFNKADKLVRYKDSTGAVLEIFSASGGASGIFGISNSSGVYTYYATLTLAMAAATSGQVIEMFADVLETAAVTIVLKDGVSINGNGHSYISSYSATNIYMFTISVAVTFTISNMRIERTAGNYYVLGHGTTGTLYLNNTYIVSNQASPVIYTDNAGAIDGGTILNTSATGSGIFINYYTRLLNVKCIVSGSGNGVYTDNYPAYLYNCYGQSNSGVGLRTTVSTMISCIGVSTSGTGIIQGSASAVTRDCHGLSTSGTGIGLGGSSYNCTGMSVSGIGADCSGPQSVNCSGISSSNVGMQNLYGAISFINFTAISSSNAAANIDLDYGGAKVRVENCYFWSKWDNAGGHAFYLGPACFPAVVSGTTLRCTNATANNIYTTFTGSFKIFKNIYIGGAGNSSTITNSMINTEDSQGNIYE